MELVVDLITIISDSISKVRKEEIPMKKISFASLLVLASCHPAFAGSANINDHFINKVTNIPNTTQQCEVVEVPVYGGNGDKTADALTGAIIGGVIGNNVTKNVDNGGAVGALLGGMIGHSNSKAGHEIVGYKQETRCKNVTSYTQQTQQVYSHSTITFFYNGKQQTVRFQK